MYTRLLINGGESFSNGEGYCYLRHRDYGSYGSCAFNSILLLAANDLVRTQFSGAFGVTNSNFGTNMNSTISVNNQGLIIEYLGA